MKTKLLLLCVLLTQSAFACNSRKQKWTSPLNNLTKSEVQLVWEGVDCDSIYIHAKNPTSKSLFLFDTYIHYCADSVQLYRYSKKDHDLFLDFIPFRILMGWGTGDVIYLHPDPHNLLRCGGYDYSFITLPPGGYKIISLPLSCLFQTTFYQEFDPRGSLHFSNPQTFDVKKLNIVMVVYDDITNMKREWIRENIITEDLKKMKMAWDYIANYSATVIEIDVQEIHNQIIQSNCQ